MDKKQNQATPFKNQHTFSYICVQNVKVIAWLL